MSGLGEMMLFGQGSEGRENGKLDIREGSVMRGWCY
jgi:hypothetical protein